MQYFDKGFPLDKGISLQGLQCQVIFSNNGQQVKLKEKWLEIEKSQIWLMNLCSICLHIHGLNPKIFFHNFYQTRAVYPSND